MRTLIFNLNFRRGYSATIVALNFYLSTLAVEKNLPIISEVGKMISNIVLEIRSFDMKKISLFGRIMTNDIDIFLDTNLFERAVKSALQKQLSEGKRKGNAGIRCASSHTA